MPWEQREDISLSEREGERENRTDWTYKIHSHFCVYVVLCGSCYLSVLTAPQHCQWGEHQRECYNNLIILNRRSGSVSKHYGHHCMTTYMLIRSVRVSLQPFSRLKPQWQVCEWALLHSRCKCEMERFAKTNIKKLSHFITSKIDYKNNPNAAKT